MKEWTREELISFIESESPGIVYFYTPLCGTCQVASRMLEIIREMVNVEIGKMNLNYYPDFAKGFAVESVPCLLFVKNGEVLEMVYAVHSVPYLLEKIKEQLL
jgi:thiol-disulfide isomerase/thioredoxin